MRQRIIINSTPQEARVALLEDNTLAEIHIERAQQRNLAGNIYKGRVARVLPGMQAAFVEVGLEKAGFIHASDLFGGPLPSGFFEDDENEDALSMIFLKRPNRSWPRAQSQRKRTGGQTDAGDESALPARPARRAHQEEPRDSGASHERANWHEGLSPDFAHFAPGTTLSVHPHGESHRGLCRIADSKERKRLRDIVQELRPPDGGFIVRTACEGLTKKEMQDDMRFLLKLWSGITKKSEATSAPALLHDDMDVALRIIRVLFSADINEVILDSQQDFERVKEFVSAFLPRLASRIKLHDRPEAIFDHYNIEAQIAKALDRAST